jgi:Lon protease-like protein
MMLNVPIFPLPDTVFFPHTLLPLHIFEPRYKALISDALAGDKMLGIVQLRPGWHDDYFGTPPIYKMLGVGKIVEVDKFDDGRYDIVLSGMYRTQVRQEISGEHYRRAEVEVIDDLVPPGKKQEVEDVHTILLRIYEKLSDALPEGLSILPGVDIYTLSPGMLVDVMTSLLVDDSYERQSLLAEPDVSRRQQLLRVQIRNLFNPLPTEEE